MSRSRLRNQFLKNRSVESCHRRQALVKTLIKFVVNVPATLGIKYDIATMIAITTLLS